MPEASIHRSEGRVKAVLDYRAGMRGWTLALAVVAVGMLGGCPKNTCFFEVCTNGDCSCPINSCTEGADFDTQKRTCVCEPDRLSVAGQCLLQAEADAYCGKGFRYGASGCEAITCPAGQALDQATGGCVAATAVAGSVGVAVGQGETLECPAGSVLVVEGGSGACVPQEQTCAPDERWDGARCAKVAACPTGSQWDPAKNTCVVFTQVGDDAAIVDVQQWAETSFGPNGGAGSTRFCNAFARKPWRFGVPQGQSATVQVVVSLSFPDAAVVQGAVATAPSYVGNPIAVPGPGVEAVQSAAQAILDTLRSGGGKANAPSAQTTVRCVVRNAAAPVAVPATGGV